MSDDQEWWEKWLRDPTKILVDTAERTKRIEICKDCDSLKMRFCVECNCYAPAKTWVRDTQCPRGKW